VRWWAIPDYILPGPLQVLSALADNLPLIVKHARSTLAECLTGFSAAIIFSFAYYW